MISILFHDLAMGLFIAFVLLTVLTVLVNLISGGIHNDLDKPRTPKKPNATSPKTSNKRENNVPSN